MATNVNHVIVDSAVYRKGERVPVDCYDHDYDALRKAASEPGDFVWVGLYQPSQIELGEVAVPSSCIRSRSRMR